jgi:hypothetical protein
VTLISDILGSQVVDADGTDLGVVADVRLVQDGPFIDGFGQALRVDALILGRGGLGVRLGFVRGGVRGPWLLRRLAGWFEHRARYVDWSEVDIVDGRYICRRRRGAVATVRETYPDRPA